MRPKKFELSVVDCTTFYLLFGYHPKHAHRCVPTRSKWPASRKVFPYNFQGKRPGFQSFANFPIMQFCEGGLDISRTDFSTFCNSFQFFVIPSFNISSLLYLVSKVSLYAFCKNVSFRFFFSYVRTLWFRDLDFENMLIRWCLSTKSTADMSTMFPLRKPYCSHLIKILWTHTS